MLSKNTNSLLDHAISKFSPEVFFHPVWLGFGTNELSNSHKLAGDLLEAAKNIQSNDPSGACQILLLCAVYQNYADNNNAWKSVQDALALARHSGLHNEVIWALWGACAISFQQGKNEQVANHLSVLEAELLLQNEWVLADFVDIVKQPLLNAEISKGNYSISSRDRPIENLLNQTFDWLQKWGYFTQSLKVEHSATSKDPVRLIVKEINSIRLFFSIQKWQHGWYFLMRILLRKMERFNQNIPLFSAAVHEKVFQMDLSAQPNKPDLENLTIHPTDFFRPPISENKSEQESVPLVVYYLGSFRVFQNEMLINSWNSLKSQSIFKYLASLNGKPVAKDILMELFWPDADLDSARRNLHQAIYSLRQTLRKGHPNYAHIQFENNCYFLNPKLDVWCDFQEFEHKVNAGRQLEFQGHYGEASAEYGIAESIYQGDFLEEDLYDEWPRAKREYLRVIYQEIMERLIKYHFSRSDYTAASILCRKVLNRDNCQEQMHRLLIQCYLAQGQRHLALRQYQICVETLRKELDIRPAATTIALYKEIRRGGSNNT